MQNFRVALLSMLSSVFLFACASDDPAPSCQQAIAHYYAAGCRYIDTADSPPTTISQTEMINLCLTAAAEAPRSCQSEIDAWLVCNNEVPTPSMTDQQCDCSTEFMALLRCS
jgi:hypothetical protein